MFILLVEKRGYPSQLLDISEKSAKALKIQNGADPRGSFTPFLVVGSFCPAHRRAASLDSSRPSNLIKLKRKRSFEFDYFMWVMIT